MCSRRTHECVIRAWKCADHMCGGSMEAYNGETLPPLFVIVWLPLILHTCGQHIFKPLSRAHASFLSTSDLKQFSAFYCMSRESNRGTQLGTRTHVYTYIHTCIDQYTHTHTRFACMHTRTSWHMFILHNRHLCTNLHIYTIVACVLVRSLLWFDLMWMCMGETKLLRIYTHHCRIQVHLNNNAHRFAKRIHPKAHAYTCTHANTHKHAQTRSYTRDH